MAEAPDGASAVFCPVKLNFPPLRGRIEKPAEK
jgi:hypothetical protein